MQFKNYNAHFFLAILVTITFLVFYVFKPFIVPFIMAAVLANLFGFMYRYFLSHTRHKKGLSSALTCLVIVLIIIVPIILISFLVVNEAQSTIIAFSQENGRGQGIIDRSVRAISSLSVIQALGGESFINEGTVINLIKGLSQNTLFIFQGAYNGVAHFVFVVFIMFFSLFYLFIDGKEFTKKIMRISPLRDKYEKMLIERFSSISRATLKGTSLVAVIQGAMGGLLFWGTGVSAPVLLGILMTFASMIPSVGSGLVWLPVGIIMLLLGHLTQGIIILAVGALVISLIDNVLKPKLVGQDTQIHPLLILLSTLGGIAIFGLAGFIIGPIIIALFIALWEIYLIEFKDQLQEFNK